LSIVFVDNIDYRLIQELQSDGRQRNVALAKKLGVTEATIRRRIRRLQDERIVDIVAIPNLHKVGYGLKAIVMLKVQLPKLRELAGKFANCPDVHYLAQCTGDYNLLFWLVCPTTSELAKFINTHLALEENCIEESRIVTEVELFKRTHDLLPSRFPLPKLSRSYSYKEYKG
jgi:Lrp/AsnC family transcriptional regulator for asnA, asnC and gidA